MIKGVIEDQIEVLESLRKLFEQSMGFGSDVEDQIEVPESLRKLFEQSTGFGSDAEAHDSDVDRIHVPHLSEIKLPIKLAAFRGLRKLITERKMLKEEFMGLIESIRKLVRVSNPVSCLYLSINGHSFTPCNPPTAQKQHKVQCSNS
jgi:hypothetical protein